MLELIGHPTVLIRKSMSDTKCTNVAGMICVNGSVLPAFLILKGKPNGQIECTEFETFPWGNFYWCQENPWMDKALMLFWVNAILKPHVAMAPDHIMPLLILDS